MPLRRGLLTRVLTSLCTAERLRREVALSFGTRWSSRGRGDDLALFTTIEARLAATAGPQDITQVAGNVLNELRPVANSVPLARLDAAHPTASLPVVLTPGAVHGPRQGEDQEALPVPRLARPSRHRRTAVELPVSAADKTRLRALCAF